MSNGASLFAPFYFLIFCRRKDIEQMLQCQSHTGHVPGRKSWLADADWIYLFTTACIHQVLPIYQALWLMLYEEYII